MQKVKILKPIRTPEGMVAKDEVINLPAGLAGHYAQRGAVEFYQTKVVRDAPEVAEVKPARKGK